MILKKNGPQELITPTPGQYTCIFHNILASSLLKPLGQSKPNFMDSLTNVYINNPGHMTKMAAMPIYGKNP